MGKEINSISIVIPVYNGEKTIGRLVAEVISVLQEKFEKLEIIMVNDGSIDQSHQCILNVKEKYPEVVKYINLARNFGEHNAVICGLRYVTCEHAAIIDDDFQNPPKEIIKLFTKLREGYDVVYSFYDVKKHSWFRNVGSRFHDLIATAILNKPRGLYLSSFKIMTKMVVDAIIQYEGPYPYIDGLILNITSSIGQQLCEHSARIEGKSNYNLRRLVRLWLNMFTNFSVVPLRLASIIGLIMSFFGFLMAIFFFISWYVGGIFRDVVPPGWASLIICVTIFSGLQMSLLGVIGEYLGRLFLTANRKPQFFIRETFGIDT
jgi:undecaprenyl-phosphate 4-deoxy-4-formamido-L-arabinose transferase